MTERYYVIPDIHGRADLLNRALTHIEEIQPEGGKIIFLGDYVDRGPDSCAACLLVRDGGDEKWEYVALQGNHEAMFIQAFLEQQPGQYYYDPNAFKDFLPVKYHDRPLDEQNRFLEPWIHWMNSLPKYHIVDNNVFVHAGWDPTKAPEQQNDRMMQWVRYRDEEPFYCTNAYLTHGHTPRKDGPVFAPNRVNLDAGAVFYGMLAVGVYERGKLGPVDILRITMD